MVEKVNDINSLYGYPTDDIFTCRIMSLAKAYGFTYDFAVFYRQIIDEKITAIISRLDGDITVSFTDEADIQEIEEFCEIIGFSSLLCDCSFLSQRCFTEGVIMKSAKKIEISGINNITVDRYPKLMELFNFLDYDKVDFEAWYVDISHRIRHGCAAAYALNFDGNMVSSAILSSIYGNKAILSGVRTLPEFRGLGYASRLVSEIVSDFNGTVYLMRDNNLNEHFYSFLGFENCGKWRIYK